MDEIEYKLAMTEELSLPTPSPLSLNLMKYISSTNRVLDKPGFDLVLACRLPAWTTVGSNISLDFRKASLDASNPCLSTIA